MQLTIDHCGNSLWAVCVAGLVTYASALGGWHETPEDSRPAYRDCLGCKDALASTAPGVTVSLPTGSGAGSCWINLEEECVQKEPCNFEGVIFSVTNGTGGDITVTWTSSGDVTTIPEGKTTQFEFGPRDDMKCGSIKTSQTVRDSGGQHIGTIQALCTDCYWG